MNIAQSPLLKESRIRQKTLILFKHFKPEVIAFALRQISGRNIQLHQFFDKQYRLNEQNVNKQNAFFIAKIYQLIDLIDKIGIKMRYHMSIFV